MYLKIRKLYIKKEYEFVKEYEAKGGRVSPFVYLLGQSIASANEGAVSLSLPLSLSLSLSLPLPLSLSHIQLIHAAASPATNHRAPLMNECICVFYTHNPPPPINNHVGLVKYPKTAPKKNLDLKREKHPILQSVRNRTPQ